MVVAIVGESSSGKSSLADKFVVRNPNFSKIVTYTTRPKRSNETEGVDYHYVSEEQFRQMIDQDYFLEYIAYRGWYYGTPKIEADKNAVVVLNPYGARVLRRTIPNTSLAKLIYLNVDRRSRMIRVLERGDNIDEAYRRNLHDEGQFTAFDKESDYVIMNEKYNKSIDEICDELEKYLNISH